MALQPRPPIVTIMGHVDHGKTSLLDYIRKTKVAAGESGGITQHIGAYQALHNGQKITFLDTPGHAAFSKMRSRGAQVTDFVILVVAANDGVMPQTIESIKHIQAAEVPFIVAINKIDVSGASPEMVKAQLTEHQVFVQGYGGDVETVEVSAKTGQGVENLLETLLLMAELHELKADPQGELEAIVIESVKDKNAGAIATILVKNGTLQVRDEIYTQTSSAKIKRMTTATGEVVTAATPSMPVEVLGFLDVPVVGEMVTTTKQTAEAIPTLPKQPSYDFAELLGEAAPKLNLILKADTMGTLQAIEQSLSDDIRLIKSEVGPITDSDILLAETTKSQVIGFHTPYSKGLQKLAEDHGVRLKNFRIIYELLENLQKQVLKLIEPTIDEQVIGEADVLQIFEMKGEKIAGCKITSGEIKKTDQLHLKRNDVIIADPRIKTMRHGKDEIQTAKVGDECGIVFTRFSNLQAGDKLVAYVKIDD